MDQERPTDPGWAGEVEQLMLHGRDGEAAELAARHLRGDRLRAATPTRGGNAMGPLEQIDELEPLLGRVASESRPTSSTRPHRARTSACAEFWAT